VRNPFPISEGIPTVLTEVYLVHVQFFQTDSGICNKLDHDCFCAHPFKVVIKLPQVKLMWQVHQRDLSSRIFG
jgi:hypothetical protein